MLLKDRLRRWLGVNELIDGINKNIGNLYKGAFKPFIILRSDIAKHEQILIIQRKLIDQVDKDLQEKLRALQLRVCQLEEIAKEHESRIYYLESDLEIRNRNQETE